MRNAIRRVRDFLAANPVRVRSAVVAVLTLVGVAVPPLAGLESSDFVVGLILAGVALVLGQGASTKVARLYDSEDAPRVPVDEGYEGRHR